MSRALINWSITLATTIAATSCGGNVEKEQAESLFVMAESAAENGDYNQSILLLDSIDHSFPKQIEVRKKGTYLRACSMERQALKELEEVERESAVLKLRNDSLQQWISKVDNPLEPYYVARTMAGKSVVGTNGIEARLMPDGTLYMISSLKNPRINHTSVTAVCGENEISTATIEHDGERNDRSMGYEVIHYMPAECVEFATFIAANSHKPVTVRYNGAKGTSTIRLDENTLNGISTLVDAAGTLVALKRNEFNRQRLEKQLELARNQAAKTFNNDQADID